MSKHIFKRQIIKTDDGSHTLFIPELNEHYHSTHGAIQESVHIFIKTGLSCFTNNVDVDILEVGFGTGLNAYLTCIEADNRDLNINFTTVEKYPVTDDEIKQLNYASEFAGDRNDYFKHIHSVKWNVFSRISDNFKLKKVEVELLNFAPDNKFNLIYFDAFAPDIQPKLWTESVFEKMYRCMKIGGILVTYSAKGQVRRNMQSAGFKVERLPGPPGKREMLRATK